MDRREAIDTLERTGWLPTLPADFRAAVLAASHLARFGAGQFVFHVGDPPGGIFGIAKGGIGVLLPGEADSLRLATVLRAGVWFGQGPILLGGQRTMTFRATERTWALHTPLAALQAIRGQSVGWMRALGSISEQAISVAVQVINDLSIPDTVSRVAATLLRCAEAGGVSPYPLKLTQDQVAEMANASRQTTSRHLNAFELRGWISRGYGQILLVDRQALADVAKGARP
jgi:CRP-like cAMP-binding protein